MGAGNNTNATYYSIGDGKICRQFNSPDNETKERVNKNGKVVHEKFYDFLEGKIVDIGTKDSDFGRSWLITLEDEEGRYILQMPYSSGYSSAFLKILPNVDLTHKVKITPKLTMDGTKKKTSLFINQRGQALKHAFTKDNPNGLPELEQKKVKGKVVYDDSDIMEFLEKMVVDEILPKLKGQQPAKVTAVDNDNEMPF